MNSFDDHEGRMKEELRRHKCGGALKRNIIFREFVFILLKINLRFICFNFINHEVKSKSFLPGKRKHFLILPSDERIKHNHQKMKIF